METVYTLNDQHIPQYCESNISVSSDRKYFSIGSNKGQIFVYNVNSGKVINILIIYSLKKQLIINQVDVFMQCNGDLIILNYI